MSTFQENLPKVHTLPELSVGFFKPVSLDFLLPGNMKGKATCVGLHRIIATYMPANAASGRVLEKLGFEREGYARKYLKIAGNWEDHVLTAKINEGS